MSSLQLLLFFLGMEFVQSFTGLSSFFIFALLLGNFSLILLLLTRFLISMNLLNMSDFLRGEVFSIHSNWWKGTESTGCKRIRLVHLRRHLLLHLHKSTHGLPEIVRRSPGLESISRNSLGFHGWTSHKRIHIIVFNWLSLWQACCDRNGFLLGHVLFNFSL